MVLLVQEGLTTECGKSRITVKCGRSGPILSVMRMQRALAFPVDFIGCDFNSREALMHGYSKLTPGVSRAAGSAF